MQQDLFNTSEPEESQDTDHHTFDSGLVVSSLTDAGILEPIDLALRDFLGKKGEPSEHILLCAALLSAANRFGHTSLEIKLLQTHADAVFGQQLPDPGIFEGLQFSAYMADQSPVTDVPKPGHEPVLPLVYDTGRLYFNRFYSYETRIAANLRRRAEQKAGSDLQPEEMKQWFSQLFDAGDESAYQRMAAACALSKNLTIVTGGPGTGKTYTVLRILLMLLKRAGTKPVRIAVAAPTGKAANRVRESMLAGMEELRSSAPDMLDVLPLVPEQTRTIHRLLGVRFQSSQFIFSAKNPLPYDVVVVDEASMVDMSLMARLLDALRPDAKLILLGDKHQLASVESGAVFADMCHHDELNVISKSFAEFCDSAGVAANPVSVKGDAETGALQDCIVGLEHSRRFSADSGIGRLASAINSGDVSAVMELLRSGTEEVVWIKSGTEACLEAIRSELQDQYAAWTDRDSAHEQKLKTAGKFQLLCAHRKGPAGVHDMNERVENLLRIRENNADGWYEGRPVIMTRNDYQLKLFNGDLGITVDESDASKPGEKKLRVAMESWDAKNRRQKVELRPVAQLENMETCWALSVHKSQGSEYDSVMLMLPAQDSPVLTRELIYTAVTRARKRVLITGSEAVIRKAVSRKTMRFSGLPERLKE